MKNFDDIAIYCLSFDHLILQNGGGGGREILRGQNIIGFAHLRVRKFIFNDIEER